MKINFKAGIGIFAGICLTASMLNACVQRAENATPYGTQRMTGTQYTGFNRNNLAGATTQLNQYTVTGNRYGTNPLNGTNLSNVIPGTNLTNVIPGTTGNNALNRTNVGYTTTGQPSDTQRALDIRRQLTGMNGIKRVNVLVFGNTALVGFQGNKGTDMNVMKRTITSKVKQIDRFTANVKVTDSADIMNRMDRIGSSIVNNTTTKPFVDEFNKLIKGL